MGGALSRTARRGAPSAVQASVQANEQAVRQAVSPCELQRKAQAEAARSAAEPEEKDAQLVSDMNRLMASISSRTEQIYRNPEVDKLYARTRKTREEKEAEDATRLSTALLKALFEDRIRSWHEGRELPVEELARQYGVDAELLRRVLRYNSVPAVQQAEDGRLIGSWPE